MKKKHYIFILIILLSTASCQENYTPKPRGFFRIDLPEKEYQLTDSIYPFRFEYPVYGIIEKDPFSNENSNFINISFPDFDGKIHLSYKQITKKEETKEYIEDSRKLVLKHISKASAIEEELIIIPQKKVFGITYDIRGQGAASPYQFFVTDSTRHFLRGALYFETTPNYDSLQPLINFVKKDILHLLNTLEWQQNNNI